MIRVLFFTIFLVAFLDVKGQDTLKPLLRKEVFDFEVGDVFQYEHIEKNYWFGGITLYTYSQIKTLSKKTIKDTIFYENEVTEKDLDGNIDTYVAQDTILYKDSSIFYGLPNYIPAGKEDKFLNQNEIYNDAFYDYSKDSIMCENWIRQKGGLGGILAYTSRFKKGLGRVYWEHNNYADPIDHSGEIYIINIIYYIKSDKIYGEPVDFITALNDKQQEMNVSIFPNPTNGIFYIKGLEDIEVIDMPYKIYNMYGEVVQLGKASNQQAVDVLTLPKGIYFLSLYHSNKKKNYHKKIIIQ